MKKSKYDFSGWATKNDLKCSDGRTIRKDAFKHCDGIRVPLVWNHMHDSSRNVLGYADLENRPQGVYAYGSFNETTAGQDAKKMVMHGDISQLSIYANKLKQMGGDVLHGAIREVSLVLSGANPGACIEDVLEHADGEVVEAILLTGEELTLNHADFYEDDDDEDNFEHKEDEGETLMDVFESLNEKQRRVAYQIIAQAVEGPADSDTAAHADGETLQDVFDTFNEKQKNVVYAMIGMMLDGSDVKHSDEDEDDEDELDDEDDPKGETKKSKKSDEDEDEDDNNEEEDEEMKHNVFSDGTTNEQDTLSHADMTAIIADAKRYGSLKDSVLAHGITDIEFLFPEAKLMNNPPDWISRDMGWVKRVMGMVHNTPFSRIKSQFADITEDEARAKGYIKGKLKKEEVFGLLKRTTTPTTIYKKQKLDRDDVIDITDFDVVAWLKAEMRVMLDEEIARAILVGDGRLSSSDDKINEQHIRPIWKDEDLYTIKADLGVNTSATDDEKAKAMIKVALKSRKLYKGSGSPVLFTTEDMLTNMLLLEDGIGRVIYDSVEKLTTALRVREIITVPVMENLRRTGDSGDVELAGIIVNLNDYNVGADKGGAVNMFDDFDIDYNAQKYLIETRCSGAMIKPFSAIALEMPVV